VIQFRRLGPGHDAGRQIVTLEYEPGRRGDR